MPTTIHPRQKDKNGHPGRKYEKLGETRRNVREIVEQFMGWTYKLTVKGLASENM